MTTEAGGPTVLVVEDEAPMRRLLRASLAAHGYQVLEAETGGAAVIAASTQNPAVVLLDLGLPDVDGVDLTRELRGWSRVPILVLSARGREQDKVDALDAGADDYVTKPFGMNELLARVRVLLRHAAERSGGDAEPIYRSGELVVDLARREVTRAGVLVHLTPTEHRLLALLVRHAGRVVTHRQILEDVWGPAYRRRTHYVRVHMAELRKKIETEPARPRFISTELGVGYRMREGDGPDGA
ncbi:MAG: response regulator [Deltaproteobacteria bacterium]|nr:response regulator [Deltaproteobacteria bacterium]